MTARPDAPAPALLPTGWVFLEAALAAWLKRHPPEEGSEEDTLPDGLTMPGIIEEFAQCAARLRQSSYAPKRARDAVRRALADGLLPAAVLFDDGRTEELQPAFWRGTRGADAMWPGERVASPSRPAVALLLPNGALLTGPTLTGLVIIDEAALARWLDGGAGAGAEPKALPGSARLGPRTLPPISSRAQALIAVQEQALRDTGRPLPKQKAQEKVEPDGPKRVWDDWGDVRRARPDLILSPHRPRTGAGRCKK